MTIAEVMTFDERVPFDPDELRGAMARREVFGAAQRIVELPTMRTYTYEILARWSHPRLGAIPAAAFVGLAEAHGLVPELDLYILDQACASLSRWRRFGDEERTISVNCSAPTLAAGGATDRILETIDRYEVPRSSVWIEATETCFLDDHAVEATHTLSAAGLHIALDDFGLGFATLDVLQRATVDMLKIDRSFVRAAEHDPKALAAIRSIVGIGAELGLAVVAEGIETGADERRMRRLGITLLQGFRYSVPLPQQEVMSAPSPHRARSSRTNTTVPPRAVAAPLPADELDRLAALHACRILDTEPDALFDTLTAIAADVCTTPIAAVSLVDEARQWFKSSVGLSVTETPREVAFCAHTILGRETLVVPNALEDPRFANNPLVAGPPGIRFYAGAPLVTGDGFALGTLCVIDHRPRRLDETQLRLLAALAEQVTGHLERHAALAALASALEARSAIEAELRHRATHDELTGLANRALFFDTLVASVAGGEQPSVVYIDIDRFKAVNDRHGHSLGDALLQWAAATITANVRGGDLVARLGGDEFAVVVRDRRQARPIVHRLREVLCQPIVVEGTAIAASASVGVADADEDEAAATTLSRADRDMYRSKRARAAT